jgi:3-dehydroquinate synthase
MTTVNVKLSHHRYDIHIEPGILARLGEYVKGVAPHALAGLLMDDEVVDPHGRVAHRSLEQAGYRVTVGDMPAGEEHKNLTTMAGLFERLVGGKLERRSPVIALGGGVIGDTVGFVASAYLRGVPFVQVPTTLLAMVDASVGGKVGVNLPQGKNLIGAFYQPQVVVIDPLTLKTLNVRELRCGMAECVKHGVIRDGALFEWIGANLGGIQALDPAVLTELIARNVEIKAKVVMADEKELGERAHLNFGHTFGHAIEATVGYGKENGYHHGEAVALGMVAAADLAEMIGACEKGLCAKIVKLLKDIGLPTHAENLAPPDVLIDSMRLDKKVAGGKIRLVLPRRMGEVFMTSEVGEGEIAGAWERLRGER